MKRYAPLLALSAATFTLLFAGVAIPSGMAYERTKTCNSYGATQCGPNQEPKPIAWPVRCVKYRVSDQGSDQFESNDGEISDRLQGLVAQAFETWNKPSCSDFVLVDGGLTSATQANFDKNAGIAGNTNLVVWRDDRWPYTGGRAAFALTSVTYDANSAEIKDADIEINSADFEFAHLEKSRVGTEYEKVDLLNTLTHEVGHLVGLDHPDDPEATMFGRAPPGEIRKRTLEQDDIDGLCAIYPAGDERTTCDSEADFIPPGERNQTEPTPLCSMGAPLSSRLPIAAGWLLLLFGAVRLRSRPNR